MSRFSVPRFRADAAFWRKLAWLGAAKGPKLLLRHSPTPIGLAFALASREQRAHVAASLRSVLGPRSSLSRQVDVARVFAQFAHSLAESLALSGNGRYTPRVDVEGAAPLLRSLAEGRGAVVATAHSAGWEIALSALLRASDVPVMVVMLPEREGAARSYHPEVGHHGAVQVVTVGEDPLSALPLLARLRRGGVVAVQADRCPSSMRALDVVVDRKTWRLPAGPFLLAATAGSPLVVVLSRRVGFLHYSLLAHEPIHLPRRPTEADLLDAARTTARILTTFVRRYPDQWFDFAPR